MCYYVIVRYGKPNRIRVRQFKKWIDAMTLACSKRERGCDVSMYHSQSAGAPA